MYKQIAGNFSFLLDQSFLKSSSLYGNYAMWKNYN